MRVLWFMAQVSVVMSLLPATALAETVAVHYRAADGRWRPLPATFDARRGQVTFALDPAQLKDGRTLIIQNPGPGMDLNDRRAPALTGAKLDGAGLPIAGTDTDLDWLPGLPRELVVGLRDRENALLPETLMVRLDGAALPASVLRCAMARNRRSARVTARLVGAFRPSAATAHTLEFSIADASPERHRLAHTWRFHHLGPVMGNPLILVDSCYGGYEKLNVLTDGKLMTPGETTVGVTWASEEVAGDHWVVLAWPAPRRVERLALHWAQYQSAYWTARKLIVQTWDGRRFVTRYEATDNPPAAQTDIALGGVTTTRLRLIQPDGGGNATKGPNIFWMDEIEVR